jgi:ATP-dependent protease ClpP protease subunit
MLLTSDESMGRCLSTVLLTAAALMVGSALVPSAHVRAADFMASASRPQAAPKRTTPPQATTSLDVGLSEDGGTLYISWSGEVTIGMAEALRTTFATYAARTHRVALFLASPGGSVEEGERVIHVLKKIAETHRLATIVMHGQICASMCIPIYLQGDDRFAARSSLWVFHEAGRQNGEGDVTVDSRETMRLLRAYYVPAGVSLDWLNGLLPLINKSNYWQTGQDLITAKSGIITNPIDNQTPRPEARHTRRPG